MSARWTMKAAIPRMFPIMPVEFVKDCDKDIIARLKTEGHLFRREQILHSYPHCWRCDSPLIYKAVTSWFVNIQSIKEAMLGGQQ